MTDQTITCQTITYGLTTLRSTATGTHFAWYGTGPSGLWAGQVRVSRFYSSAVEACATMTRAGFVPTILY